MTKSHPVRSAVLHIAAGAMVLLTVFYTIPDLGFATYDYVMEGPCREGITKAAAQYQKDIAALPRAESVEERARQVFTTEARLDAAVSLVRCPTDIAELQDDYLAKNKAWMHFLAQIVQNGDFNPAEVEQYQAPAGKAFRALMDRVGIDTSPQPTG